MAVVFENIGAGQIAEGSTPNPGLPASTVAGNLLVWGVAFEKGSDVTVTNPTGFTTLVTINQSANVGLRVAWKIAAGSDSVSGSLSIPVKYSTQCARFTGHDPTTPFRTPPAGASSSSGNPDPPDHTGLTSGDLVLAYAGAKTQTTYTPPTNYTERYDLPNTSGGIPSHSMASREITTSSENPGTFTPASASEWAAATVAIAPVAAVVFPGKRTIIGQAVMRAALR